MKNNSITSLNSSEIANLWTQFITDSMALCVNSYLAQTCTDPDVQDLLALTLKMSDKHIQKITSFFKEDYYPIPDGFLSEPINLKAPQLFSNQQCLIYLQIMTLHGLNSYSLCATTSSRPDQLHYYTECVNETVELYNNIISIQSKKGILTIPARIQIPKEVTYIQSNQYLNGWFGNKRPLNVIEISGLFYNMQKTIVKIMIELGFSQTAHSKELRAFFKRGVKLCDRQLKSFEKILAKDYLPSPKRWEFDVSNSNVAPFSDKVMLFLVTSLISASIGYYGSAMASCQRADLIVMYTKRIAEVALYAEDGFNLLIKNGWMEQPPMAADRDALSKKY